MQEEHYEQGSLWHKEAGLPTRWDFDMLARYCRAKGIECVLTYQEGESSSTPFSIEQYFQFPEWEIGDSGVIIYVDSTLTDANKIYSLLSKLAKIYFREAPFTLELQQLWIAALLMGIDPEIFTRCLEEIESSNEPASWYQSTVGGKRLRAAYQAGKILGIPHQLILQWASQKSRTLLQYVSSRPDEYPQFKEHPYDWLKNTSSFIPLAPYPKPSTPSWD